MTIAWTASASIVVAVAAAVPAIAAPQAAPVTPEQLARAQRQEDAARAAPDTIGSGRFAALKEEDASLPDHTVYRPKDLAALGGTKLPIVVWGNGGCAGDGAGQRQHLLELASHGYLVIANGVSRAAPASLRARPARCRRPARAVNSSPRRRKRGSRR